MLREQIIQDYTLLGNQSDGRGMVGVWCAKSSLEKSVAVKLFKAKCITMDNYCYRFHCVYARLYPNFGANSVVAIIDNVAY